MNWLKHLDLFRWFKKYGLEPKGVEAIPRRTAFDFDDRKKYWANGNPQITAFMAAMSVSFPPGEQEFIDSVRNYMDDIKKDPELHKRVRGFIGQEAHHSRMHENLNDELRRHGVPVDAIERRINKLVHLGKTYTSRKRRLAFTIGMEHFTAIMCSSLLQHYDHCYDGSDKELMDLFMWHAIEEVEHKSVAFDVYQKYEGGYFFRILVFFSTTIIFSTSLSYNVAHTLIKQGHFFDLKGWAHAIWFLWGKPGILRKTVIPYFKYYSPTFHPWDDDDSHLLDKYHPVIAPRYLVSKKQQLQT